VSIAPTNPETLEPIGAHSDLLGLLLNEQREMSAVERFAQMDEQSDIRCHSAQFESLLPQTPLEDGEQYAFSVDLDRCSGCKACVTACHNLNGLDDAEAWRDVGLLYSESSELPVLQHVTSACHHCIDPACLNACPTNSYEKDPTTGIVRHLDDQCFGCQYCTLACPYGVPKYHSGKGIVRKCDMCSQRLAQDESPACVQACPHDAIAIKKVSVEEVRGLAQEGTFITGAHDPSYTIPTTEYKSKNPIAADLIRGDTHLLKPEHAHLPLVIMLVLIQVSVGAFLFLQLSQFMLEPAALASLRPWLALAAFGVSQAALAASTMHLGRPMYAYRGILGFRHSWMSREIVAFGLYTAAAGTFVASLWIPEGWMPLQSVIQQVGGWGAVVTGYLGIFCSVMIYQCTQRAYWNGSYTSLKFSVSAFVGGTALLLMTAPGLGLFFTDIDRGMMLNWLRVLSTFLAIALVGKSVIDCWVLRHLNAVSHTPLSRSAHLMTGHFARSFCFVSDWGFAVFCCQQACCSSAILQPTSL